MDKARILKNLQPLKAIYPDIHTRCTNLVERIEEKPTEVFDSINSSDTTEKQSGIYLIVCLADASFDEETIKITNFAKNLLRMLTINSQELVIRLASKAVAYLILTSKSYAVELMEVALNQCFEWLEEPQRNEQRRLAAVILAKDLAIFTQSHFFQRANQFFSSIFKCIRDSKANLRLAAAEALCAEACQFDFPSISRDDILHGSLLIFNELLRIANYSHENARLQLTGTTQHFNKLRSSIVGQNPVEWLLESVLPAPVESRTARTLITDYFQEIVKNCFEARNSKAPHCQLILLELFPRLASFSDNSGQHLFCYVPEAAEHSLSLIGKYSEAMLTLGLLALSRPLEIRPKIAPILNILIQHMHLAVSKKKLVHDNDFKCLSLVVRSQRSFLCEKIRELLPLFFSTGISEGLITVMHDIIQAIPELKSDVFDGLMDQLYHLLMDRPRPSKLAPPTAPPIPSGPIQPVNIPQTKLALKTLGEFNFSRHSLQMFLRYVAMGYLISDSVEIRLTAVYSCTEMLKPFIMVYENVENQQKAEVYNLIRNVLECLVKTAVVDIDFNVRLYVLNCFCNMDKDFLFHLSQREMLDTIFLSLHDENYQVREQSVELLGKLSNLNPSFVFLKFRRILLESISQLANSKTLSNEVQGARMIAHLARQSPRFISAYMNSILLALLPHMKIDKIILPSPSSSFYFFFISGISNVELTVHVLNVISELSLIGGLEMVRSIDKLFPPIISFLQDSTSLNRREAALRAMGRLCQCVGYVVEPYKDYPDLLEILLQLLKTELSCSMRRLTMRLLGIIGALDPYTYKVYIGKVHSHIRSRSLALTLPNSGETTDIHVMDIINWINYERLTLSEYYPALAISNLMLMLQDPQRCFIFHKEIMHAILQIFTNLTNRPQYLGQVIPPLIEITEKCKPQLRSFFLNQFSRFISIINLQLQPYMTQFFSLIAKVWCWSENTEIRGIIIRLIEDVGRSFGEKFTVYATDLCPYLLNVLQNDNSPDKKLTLHALSCTQTISKCLGTHIHLILSPILSCIEDVDLSEKNRLAALETVISLSLNHPINEQAPQIMQTWMRCICIKFLQPKLIQLLSTIIKKWDQFPIYKESVNSALKRYRVDASLRQEYREQLANLQVLNAQNLPLQLEKQPITEPSFAKQIQFLPPSEIENTTTSKDINLDKVGAKETHFHVNLEQLRRCWTIQTLTSREDWLQWLITLRVHFIRQSPSPPIRSCTALSEAYDPLAKELFNAAFISVWTELRESDQNQLTLLLIDILKHCPHAEPIQAILNLAEFMDHSEKGPFPVDYNMLSKSAEQTRAYAKALRYKELDIIKSRKGEPNAEDCQTLIILFNKLNLEEGAAGIVQYARRHNMEISGRWYEKLGEWEKALEMYRQEMLLMPDTDPSWTTLSSASSLTTTEHHSQQQLQLQQPSSISGGNNINDISRHSSSINCENSLNSRGANLQSFGKFDIELHQMRCLEALGQWSQLNNACQTALLDSEINEPHLLTHQQSGTPLDISLSHGGIIIGGIGTSNSSVTGGGGGIGGIILNQTLNEYARRQKIAQMAARANWAIGDFDKMTEYVQMVNENTQEGSFMRAVLAIRDNDFERAYSYINKVRDIFDSELTAMATESYDRAYGAMVTLQELTELEEAVDYKMLNDREARIAMLWSRRLQGCRPNIDHWRRILMVRSIIFSQNELRPLWIKFAALCRREGKQAIARNILRSLLDVSGDVSVDKLNIPFDKPQLALAVCKQLWSEGQKRIAFTHLEQLTKTLHRLIERNRLSLPREHLEPMARITAKCYLKLGEWQESLQQQQAIVLPGERHGSFCISPAMKVQGTSTLFQQQQQYSPYLWNITTQQPQQTLFHQPLPTNTTTVGSYIQQRQAFEQSTAMKLHYYVVATSFDQNWYKAWHRLATTYYSAISQHQTSIPSQLPNLLTMDIDYPTTGKKGWHHHHTQQPSQQQQQMSAYYTPIPSQQPQTIISDLTTIPPPPIVERDNYAHPLPLSNIPIAYSQSTANTNSNSPSMLQSSPLRAHQLVTNYAVNAVRCFFKAIQLAEGSRLDDTLRLLMLWFDYGDRPEVFELLRDSLKMIPSEVWLEVVPQLIARLDSQNNTGLLVRQLVIDVAKAYPQAWVYALTAAIKSRNARRSQVAKEILDIVAENKPILVEQATLVNDELIRCAILWHEQWHEALEEASRFYFQDKNVDEMMNILRPLHQKIEQGHTTMKEQSFNHTYYKDLKDAFEHCEVFRRTGNQKEMTAAWDLYYNIFKRISNQLRQMNTLDLNYISPRLCKARNLELSIPGTYDPNTSLITIASIHSHLQVIMSKQRPRKIYMRGNDGKEYAFLLKGHEDPRQDERVMQLFGLVNSLILREAETSRRNLTIQRYSITTLSQSSGLIGWVPNCDTLHALIKDYREKKKILISEEHNKMQKLCVDIDKCTLLQRVEIFEEALRSTSGDDLRQTLWMKSPNSEVWFDRRTNYTRSMGVMSMVGYILGLGDRHPSNLMLDRLSGKIVHIDFGDCFEVAMKREKYPEKIPFRLTRMLIQSMEVTGIDGNYRLTCERVLRLLRANNDSILAVLESFVYDPMLNWRLTEGAAAMAVGGGGGLIGANNGTLKDAAARARVPLKIAEDPTANIIPPPIPYNHPHNWRQQQQQQTYQQQQQLPEEIHGGGKAFQLQQQQQRGEDNEAINRVKAKLCGRDFNPFEAISVSEQVDRLIEQATMNDNLCQCYIGWCPFW
ncbi:hypothetical protein Mgra_00001404 [Meloidogyne graminicola]|uniref:non-specific serine/threonine protein kinase n=1 Tax=Meloidogyne graminicola TaxID=189291 RepID=A0A8S9ZZN5_9BILA|nr:hypothetical protein Mgra_00001404 [Meloidogyne graminicola]